MNNHTRFSKETLQNLEHYLSRTGGHMYAKNAGSSEGAVWERPEFTATLRLTDLTHTNPIDYALFEFFPGIMIRVSKNDKDKIDMPCYKNVAAYCAEFIKPGFGVMEVSPEHRDVFFKFDFPIRENTLSESTIEAMERRATEVFNQHRENLTFLANTFIPYKKFRELFLIVNKANEVVKDNVSVDPENARMFSASLDSIRRHLEKHSGHNIVAESLDKAGNPTWKCEIFTGRDHYFLDLSANQRTGMLTLKAMDGPKSIPIDVDTRREVAAYLAETSSVRKVGYLWSGDDTEGISCVTNASLIDGVIGGDTIELMEGLMLKSLDDVRAKANALAYGEEMEDDGRASGTSRLEMLRKMLGKDDDDDDSDDGGKPDTPFGGGRSLNFSSMMADVLARAKGSHEDHDDDISDLTLDTSDGLDEPDDDDSDAENSGDSGLADLLSLFASDRSRSAKE